VLLRLALSGMTHDLHADVKQDEGIMAMHADAERLNPRTEEVFKILQVGAWHSVLSAEPASHPFWAGC
jgi:hypothetical protein